MLSAPAQIAVAFGGAVLLLMLTGFWRPFRG